MGASCASSASDTPPHACKRTDLVAPAAFGLPRFSRMLILAVRLDPLIVGTSAAAPGQGRHPPLTGVGATRSLSVEASIGAAPPKLSTSLASSVSSWRRLQVSCPVSATDAAAASRRSRPTDSGPAHAATGAATAQSTANFAASLAAFGLWVVRCLIEATLEHSQAPGAYVQACAWVDVGSRG
jgi:hypothetical protein